MSFSKKHYETIAKVLKAVKDSGVYYDDETDSDGMSAIIGAFVGELSKNPKFNAEKFTDAVYK